MKKSNLYEDMGVPKTASMDDIKQAFRKNAKKTHPDNGGDAEKFKALMHAYDILSDDEKRKRYDSGENVDTPQDQPLSVVFKIFNAVVDDFAVDITHNDIFDIVRQNIMGNQQILNTQKSKAKDSIKRFENILKRIKKDGKTEPFILFLESRIRESNAAIAQIDRNLKIGEDALAFIKDCKYEFEPMRRSIVMNFGGTSTSASW